MMIASSQVNAIGLIDESYPIVQLISLYSINQNKLCTQKREIIKILYDQFSIQTVEAFAEIKN